MSVATVPDIGVRDVVEVGVEPIGIDVHVGHEETCDKPYMPLPA
jgi:hypothetical protein